MGNEKIRVTGRCWLLAACMASVGLLIGAAPLALWAQTGIDATSAQESSAQGVTVKMTAKSIGRAFSRWEFAVVLDTHSADLGDDLIQSASLTTADGRKFVPAAWLGAPPGGHHREGVLAFDVPEPRTGAIELRIDRPGESAPRTFRWQL